MDQIIVKVMFTSLPVPVFREFIFKTNLMRNQEKSFSNLKYILASQGAGSVTLNKCWHSVWQMVLSWEWLVHNQHDNVLPIVYYYLLLDVAFFYLF
jgi:hypothetical protein